MKVVTIDLRGKIKPAVLIFIKIGLFIIVFKATGNKFYATAAQMVCDLVE